MSTPVESPSVRAATAADLETLVSYNVAMALETERLELDHERLRKGIQAVLDDPLRGFYLISELGERTAGALMITTEWSDWRAGWCWWIQSVYVPPESRRRGVYRALYAEVCDRARSAGDVRGLRLYVEHDNARAQATYRSLGMSPSRYDLFHTDL